MEIQINQEMIDNVYNVVMEASSEVVAKDIEVSWSVLVEEAEKFLVNYEILDTQADMLVSEILQAKLFNDPATSQYANQKNSQKQALILKSKYMLAARFNDYLEIFRESVPSSMVYIFQDSSNQVCSYEMSLRDMIRASSFYNNSLTYSLNASTIKNEEMVAMEDREDFINLQHLKEAMMAYQGTYNRLEQFYKATEHARKKKAKEKGKQSQRQGALLLWKIDRYWQKGFVLNYGDVKEAYFSYLMDEHQNELCMKAGGEAPYYDHDFIGTFFTQYIQNVTNLAAIVEEDVVTQWAQYGVKSGNAKLPSLHQYVKFAQWVVENKDKQMDDIQAEILNELKRENPQEVRRNITLTTKQAVERFGRTILNAAMSAARS